MTRLITIANLKEIIHAHSLNAFFCDLIAFLKEDFSKWKTFHKIPRVAAHYPQGVIELMPIWDNRYFSYKYVNGHPNNTQCGCLTVVAFGALSDVKTGYPLLVSEMTLLTALRTAATSALASDFLAKKQTKIFGIIGTGAQSEFQVLAHLTIRPIQEVKYFDIDPHAMKRFEKNLKSSSLKLTACSSIQEVVKGCDLITTATAASGHHEILKDSLIKPGVHINDIGGDSPGKTELSLDTVKRAKVVIEFLPQTQNEGEIQRLNSEERKAHVHAELWELITGAKQGRASQEEITLFDSVGFALEDYSVLRLVLELSRRYKLGTELPLIPEQLTDPKNLFSLLD